MFAKDKALVRALFERAINEDDASVATEVLAPDHRFVDGFGEILGLGADGLHALTYDRQLRARDLRFEVEDLIAEDGVVAAVWIASGTTWRGDHVRVRGMSRHQLRAGKIARSLITFNPFGLLPKL